MALLLKITRAVALQYKLAECSMYIFTLEEKHSDSSVE